MINSNDDWLLETQEILLNVFHWGEEQEYESNMHVLMFIIHAYFMIQIIIDYL